MRKMLIIALSLTILLITSCDSGGDGNSCGDFNGSWVGETVTTTWSDDDCGSDFEVDISCYEITVSNNTAVFDLCNCDGVDEDECIDEEELSCDDSDDPDDMDCEVNDDVITCTSSEEDDDDCIQTTTMIFVRD